MAFNSFLSNLFMTPSQKKELDNNYYQKMYPFGSKQKDWEDKIIEKLYADKSKLIPTIKYMCLTRREMYIDLITNDEYYDKKYRKLIKRMSLSEEDINFVETFTKLEYSANSYSNLPTIEEIKEKCNM